MLAAPVLARDCGATLSVVYRICFYARYSNCRGSVRLPDASDTCDDAPGPILSQGPCTGPQISESSEASQVSFQSQQQQTRAACPLQSLPCATPMCDAYHAGSVFSVEQNRSILHHSDMQSLMQAEPGQSRSTQCSRFRWSRTARSQAVHVSDTRYSLYTLTLTCNH